MNGRPYFLRWDISHLGNRPWYTLRDGRESLHHRPGGTRLLCSHLRLPCQGAGATDDQGKEWPELHNAKEKGAEAQERGSRDRSSHPQRPRR